VDEGERRDLVDANLGLVKAIAAQVKKQVASRLELDDLIAYGSQGLLEAAERFDPRQGVAFSSFAYHRIRGAVYDGLRRMGSLPRREWAKIRMREKANDYLANLAAREQGAAASGSPLPAPSVEDDLRAMYEALAGVATTYVVSLEHATDEEMIEHVPTSEEQAVVRQLGGRVRQALGTLPEKERHFIEKHYFEDKTLTDAGAELGLSKSWASRLHARAIELLRKALDE
jgi:RNA polymerase sigma factor for flagellar operon FliA